MLLQDIEITNEKIKGFFGDIIKECKKMNNEDVEKVYEELMMTIFIYDTNTIPCFSKIKKESVMGMTFEQVKKLHTYKFKKIGKKYASILLEEENRNIPSMSGEDFNKFMVEKSNGLIDMLKDLSEITKKFTLKDFVEFHKVIINGIMVVHLEASNSNIGEKEREELKESFRDKFIKIFGKHYGMLGCGKK